MSRVWGVLFFQNIHKNAKRRQSFWVNGICFINKIWYSQWYDKCRITASFSHFIWEYKAFLSVQLFGNKRKMVIDGSSNAALIANNSIQSLYIIEWTKDVYCLEKLFNCWNKQKISHICLSVFMTYSHFDWSLHLFDLK